MSNSKPFVPGDRKLSTEEARARLLQTTPRGMTEAEALTWARKRAAEERRLPPVFPTVQTKQCKR